MDPRAKKLVITYLLAALVVMIAGIWWSGSIVYVSKPSNTNDPSLVIRKVGETDNSKTSYGLHFLAKGDYIMDFAEGNKTTRKTPKIGPFGIKRIGATLQEEKKIDKVSTDAENCVFGSQNQLLQGKAFSYDCVTLTQISYNDFEKRTVQEKVGNYYNLYPSMLYKSGVIGVRQIASEEESRVTQAMFTFGPDKDQVVNLDGYEGSTIDSLFISATSDSFSILDSRSGRLVTLYNFPGDPTQNISEIKLPGEEFEVLSLHTFKESAFVYSIKTPAVAEETDHIVEAQLNEYSLVDGSLIRTIYVDDFEVLNNELGDFDILNENTLVASSVNQGGAVTIFEMTKDKLKRKSFALEAFNFVIYEGRVLVLSIDGGIYEYFDDSQELRAVFNSDNTKLDYLYQDFERVTMVGRAEIDNTNLVLGFLLTDQDQGAGINLTDSLPLADEYNGVPFRLADYISDKIYIYSGPIGYGGRSPEENINNTISLLRESGLDLNQYKIISQ